MASTPFSSHGNDATSQLEIDFDPIKVAEPIPDDEDFADSRDDTLKGEPAAAGGLGFEALRLGRLRTFAAAAAVLFCFQLGVQFLSTANAVGEAEISLVIGCAGAVAIAGLLFTRRSLSLKQLRPVELVLLGLLALAMLVAEYCAGADRIAATDAVGCVVTIKNGVLAISALIVAYGIWIPNPPRACARVAFTVALGPLIVMALLYQRNADQGALIGAATARAMAISNAIFLVLAASLAVLAAFVSNRMANQLGEARRLGQYQIGEKLGDGRLGEIYLAEHDLLKRPCALRILKTKPAAAKAARFDRDLQAASLLSHPNAVEIYDYGQSRDGRFYCATEFLPGMNVGDLVRQFGPLPPARAVYLLRQICKPLAAAHAVGLIHRRVCPSNIFVSILGGEYDIAKLLDLGLGLVEPDLKLLETETAKAAVGTADLDDSAFVAPEQLLQDDMIDGRGDLFSLGAVLHFLLTGKSPQRELADAFTSANVPADLQAVVRRCLASSPSDRYADARLLSSALAACVSGETWDEASAEEWWQQEAGDRPPREDAL